MNFWLYIVCFRRFKAAVCLPLSHALRGGQNEAVTFDCFRDYLCIYAVRVVLSLLPVCVSHFGF